MSGCESCTSCGVRTRSAGPLLHLDANQVPLMIGDQVVVQVNRAQTIGKVVSTDGIERKRGSSKGRVLRHVDDEDRARQQMNTQRSRDVFEAVREKIRAMGRRDVDLVQASFTLDGSQLEIFYVAEQSIDLSEVATELSVEYRTEVELRPVGVRDRVKLLGAVGICGLETCCSTWIEDFHPVSVKMAKAQDLSLNDTRLTGVCGRLKCCLAYETRAYERARRKMPRYGKKIETEQGTGRVVGHDILGQKVRVELEDGTRIEHVLGEPPPLPGEHKPAAEPSESAVKAQPSADAPPVATESSTAPAEPAVAAPAEAPETPSAPEAPSSPAEPAATASPGSAAAPKADAEGKPKRKRRRRRGGRKKPAGGGDASS